MTEKEKYFDIMRSWDPESIIDGIYFACSNEQLFWIACKLFEQSDNCTWSIHERNEMFSAAKREISGLIHIGFMDRKHMTILSQYGIVPQ